MTRKKILGVDREQAKDTFIGCLSAIIIWLVLLLLLTAGWGCKLLSKVEKSERDSTSVSRTIEDAGHVDNSKSSKEAEYERATYLFPRDTSVVNNHIYPTAIIYEKGKSKESEVKDIEDKGSKTTTDSTTVSVKEKESTTKAGLSTLEIILIGFLGLMFYEKLRPLINKITKL